MSERWKQVEDSNYYVCEDGRIKGLRGLVKMRTVNGRLVVKLYRRSSTLSVHRLVAIAFIPNPESHPFVRHKDGNLLNCHVSNLEWGPRPQHDGICKQCGDKKPMRHFPKINAISEVKGVIYRRRTCNSCLGKADYARRKEKMIAKLFDK